MVNLQKFWELRRPPPLGKNSQKITYFFCWRCISWTELQQTLEWNEMFKKVKVYAHKIGWHYKSCEWFLQILLLLHELKCSKSESVRFFRLAKLFYSHQMMSFHHCGIYILWWGPIIFVYIIKIANDFCTPSCLDPHWPAGPLRGNQIIFYDA